MLMNLKSTRNEKWRSYLQRNILCKNTFPHNRNDDLMLLKLMETESVCVKEEIKRDIFVKRCCECVEFPQAPYETALNTDKMKINK